MREYKYNGDDQGREQDIQIRRRTLEGVCLLVCDHWTCRFAILGRGISGNLASKEINFFVIHVSKWQAFAHLFPIRSVLAEFWPRLKYWGCRSFIAQGPVTIIMCKSLKYAYVSVEDKKSIFQKKISPYTYPNVHCLILQISEKLPKYARKM